jgi:predicted nucleic acid-binding protein
MNATPFVSEDFESNSLASYTGDLSSFSIQTGVVKTGIYALRASFTNAGAATRQIISTTGLPLYPVAGQVFEFWTQLSGAGTERIYMLFGALDSSNAYRLVLRNNAIAGLQKLVAAAATNLAIGSVASYAQGSWYRFVVSWGYTGTIGVQVFDSGGTSRMSVSAVDTTYTYGGISWQAINVAGLACLAYYDALQVTGRAA